MKNLKDLFGKTYHPLNKISISQKNLLHNYNYLSSINRNIQIAPVLKSNAYGHGLIQIAKILEVTDAPFICVDSLFEAYELLKNSIKKQVLIMGYIDPKNLKVKNLPFSYAIYDTSQLEALNEYQKKSQVHIKVDTGMHRLGVPTENLDVFLKNSLMYTNVQIVGLMSHFAQGNDSKSKITKLQIENFIKAKTAAEKHKLEIKYFHISASDGLLCMPKTITNISNVARTGIALYGISHDSHLKPVIELSSKIVQIKKLNPGESVGYDSSFTANKKIKLAVLPIGYNDGVDRRLSNVGFVKVRNHYCKIVGRVSMNITTIDISNIKNAKIGQEVIIYSQDPQDKNSIANTAKLCKTIPHDILIHLHPTAIRREII